MREVIRSKSNGCRSVKQSALHGCKALCTDCALKNKYKLFTHKKNHDRETYTKGDDDLWKVASCN